MESDQFEALLYAFEAKNLKNPNAGHLASKVVQPAKDRILKPVPSRYSGSALQAYLHAHSSPEGIYKHQAMAGDLLDQGQNVVLTTSTGSGKSRVFMTEAFHLLEKDPTARVLVLYPLKALGSDQLKKWHDMAEALNMPSELIGQIDGRVPMGERLSVVSNSRVLLATPDIVHTWMMSNINKPAIQDFIKNRQLTVLDELDVYNALFGTNQLYLLRRLEAHQAKLRENFSIEDDHRFIAASATLPNAPAFFEELTGQTAVEISEADNGAPRYERMIAHYSCASDDRFKAVEKLISGFIADKQSGQAIVFFDSRRDVEEMAARINAIFGRVEGDEIAVPQKAGYTAAEQARLEMRFRSGVAKVIIGTPAVELGIDLPNITLGVNVGLPSSKKKLMQRIGRVGRAKPGLFMVLAPYNAFSANKKFPTLEAYLEEMPLEAPSLYPSNQFIQIAQAYCLQDERKKMAESGVTLYKPQQKIKWPRGFVKSQKQIDRAYETLTGERSLLIPPKIHVNKPQYYHTLRSFSGSTFLLSVPMGGGDVQFAGSCSLEQALAEYPPGAIVRHAGKRKRVKAWENVKGQDRIILVPYSGPNKTNHRVKRTAKISMEPDNIVIGAFYQQKPAVFEKTQAGMNISTRVIAETMPMLGLVRASVNQVVNAFVEITPQGKAYPYRYYDDFEMERAKDLVGDNAVDYGPKRRTRMPTTGLMIYIPERWFGEYVRAELAEKIVEEYCAGMDIDRQDIGYISKSVTAWTPDGRVINNHVLFIYDRVPGSLGLTNGLITSETHSLRHILRSMAVKAKAEDDSYTLKAVQNLYAFMNSLELKDADHALVSTRDKLEPPKDHYLMIAAGSYGLQQMTNGSSVRVKIIRPAIVQGTPGYFVEKPSRKNFFKGGHFVTAHVERDGTVKAISSHMKKAAEPVQHFVALNHIEFERGNYIAMHRKTGATQKLVSSIDTNGQSRHKWVAVEGNDKTSPRFG